MSSSMSNSVSTPSGTILEFSVQPIVQPPPDPDVCEGRPQLFLIIVGVLWRPLPVLRVEVKEARQPLNFTA